MSGDPATRQLTLPKDITDKLEIGNMIILPQSEKVKLRLGGYYQVGNFTVKVDRKDDAEKTYHVYVCDVKNGNSI